MSTTNVSDTRATAALQSQDLPAQKDLVARDGAGRSNILQLPDGAGMLNVRKRLTNGHSQDTLRRVVSEDLSTGIQAPKKRASRYSAGFLLDSLSNLNRKRRKQDSGLQDASTTSSGTVLPQISSIRQNASPSLDESSSRRSDPSPAPTSSFRASTSDRTSTPEYGNGYLSPPRSSKGKERASPGIGEGTSWSMTSGRTSMGTEGGRLPSAQYASPYVQPIDPTTLVQLALNLSQSRRMNLAPGLLAQNNSPNGQRAVSAGYTSMNGSIQPTPTAGGGSLRRDRSDQYHDANPSSLREQLDQRSSLEGTPSALDNDLLKAAPFQPSAGTLARAAKARAFFQLSSDYHRLLQFLPPLKPRNRLNEDAPLGRAYNPLQYIRNKQVRARGREAIDGETSGWNAADRVSVWVDTVSYTHLTLPTKRIV